MNTEQSNQTIPTTPDLHTRKDEIYGTVITYDDKEWIELDHVKRMHNWVLALISLNSLITIVVCLHQITKVYN